MELLKPSARQLRAEHRNSVRTTAYQECWFVNYLPAEVRCMIYRFVFDEQGQYDLMSGFGCTFPNIPVLSRQKIAVDPRRLPPKSDFARQFPILQTCKFIRVESLHILYEKLSLRVFSNQIQAGCLQMIDEIFRPRIRSLAMSSGQLFSREIDFEKVGAMLPNVKTIEIDIQGDTQDLFAASQRALAKGTRLQDFLESVNGKRCLTKYQNALKSLATILSTSVMPRLESVVFEIKRFGGYCNREEIKGWDTWCLTLMAILGSEAITVKSDKFKTTLTIQRRKGCNITLGADWEI